MCLYSHVLCVRCCLSTSEFWLTWLSLPLGGGPSFILACHLQHRAEDGREREKTADGPWIPREHWAWTERHLRGRSGTEVMGNGQSKWWGCEDGERTWTWWVVTMGLSGIGGLKESTLPLIPLGWGENYSHMVLTRGDTNNVAWSSPGSCLELSYKALIFFYFLHLSFFSFLMQSQMSTGVERLHCATNHVVYCWCAQSADDWTVYADVEKNIMYKPSVHGH